MQDLKDVTQDQHYENFRAARLADKEMTNGTNYPAVSHMNGESKST